MVLPDWNSAKTPPTDESPILSFEPAVLARPVDRLAAMIIDLFIVLTPIYILISSPLKKLMTTSYLLGSEAEFIANIVGMVMAALILLVTYQTLFHFLFKATIGKMLLHLQVVPMFPGQKITLWDHFTRAWVFVFEVSCFGLPWLSVFSNSRRRSWHDRICDTLVVTRADNGVMEPAPWEQALVRAFFAFFIAVSGIFMVSQIQGTIAKIKDDETLAALVEQDQKACEAVNKNVTDQQNEDDHGRLKLAMTLYAAGLADRSCLEAEVDREKQMEVSLSPLTNLAKAFIYADDADVSNSYLEEVCDSAPQSVECHMSEVVSHWSDEDWDAVEGILTKAPRGSGYLEVWGVRHFMKQASYGKATELLNSLVKEHALAEFNLSQRVRALFNSYHEPEAEAALLQALSALPESESMELSSWVCAQQLQNGCAAVESPACQQIENLGAGTTEINFDQSSEAIARVLALECRSEGKLDYLTFIESVEDHDWQTFFRANLKRQRRDKDASGHLYSQLLFSNSAPEILKIEAARRWIQFADHEQISDVFKQWQDMDSREAWVKTGNMLLKRMNESGEQELAVEVARSLLKTDSLAPEAQTYLTELSSRKPKARQPASAKEDP